MVKLEAVFAVDSAGCFVGNKDLITRNNTALKHLRDRIGGIVVMDMDMNEELPVVDSVWIQPIDEAYEEAYYYHGLEYKVNIVITDIEVEGYAGRNTHILFMDEDEFKEERLYDRQVEGTFYVIGNSSLIEYFATQYNKVTVFRFKKHFSLDETIDLDRVLEGMKLIETIDYLEFQIETYEPVSKDTTNDKIDCNKRLEDAVTILDNDMVNSPSHYQLEDGSEVYDHIYSILGRERTIGYCQGNALKYIARAGKKDDEIQDINKAITYLGFWKKVLEDD